MATKIHQARLKDSVTPGSLIVSNDSNIYIIQAPTAGADHLWGYDDSDTATVPITLGTNLSMTGTTLNAASGAGGYSEVQEEGSGVTARTKINFIGAGFTATDDIPNTRTNITLDATLNALAGFNTNGFLVQTAADTFAGRTLVGTANRITVTPGDGGSGNPTFDISTSYVGQASITTLGTITTGIWNGTTIAVANGGTGLTVGTSGGILGFTGTTTLASSALLAANAIMLGGGAGATPTTLGSLGTTSTVLHGNAAGAPTFGAVSLTADITGTLPVANGGTGVATITGLLQGNGTGAITGITNSSTVGQILRVTGASTYAWGALDLADADAITGDLPFANLAQGSALSVLGVTGNLTADNASIIAGTDNQVLRRSGTAVAFGAVNLASSDAVTGTLAAVNGGTGQSSYTIYDMLYAGSTTTLSKLANGTTGQVLTATTGGAPSWAALPAADGNGIYSGSGAIPPGTVNATMSAASTFNIKYSNAIDALNIVNNASVQLASGNNLSQLLLANSGIAMSRLAFVVATDSDRVRIEGPLVLSEGSAGGVIDPSAVLDIISTTKALFPPRMTTAQRDAMGAVNDGATLYNTDTDKLTVRAATTWVELGAGGGGLSTASNGLTATGADVALGGSLTGATTIAAAGNTLTVTTSKAGATNPGFTVTNSSTGTAIKGSANGAGGGTGYGIWGTSAENYGVKGDNASGIAGGAFFTIDASTNTILNGLIVDRQTTGSAAAGIGVSLDFNLETSTTISTQANTLVSKWTTATHASRVSEFSITGVDNAVAATLLTLSGSGATKLNKYGVGTFTGTPAYTLQVDASGNIIEGTGGSGSVATDAIWDAAGDLAVGTGANTAARLAMGTANQQIRVNAGGTALEYFTPTDAGITTLNTLTTTTQTFATGTAGTDFNISSSGSTHTFNIPHATTGNRGLVTIGGQTFGGLKTFVGGIESGATGGTNGSLNLIGSTSGNVTVQAPTSGVGWILTLPANDGDANQFLQTDGSGVTSWASVNYNRAYVAKTAAYGLTTSDYLVEWTSGTVAATLPTAVGDTGREFIIKNSGTGVITINTTSSQTIDGTASGVITLNQYDSLHVYSNGTNWLVI